MGPTSLAPPLEPHAVIEAAKAVAKKRLRIALGRLHLERPARHLRGDFGAHAIGPLRALEHLEALARLRAERAEIADERLDPDLVLQVHAEVRLGLRAIFHRLPILAHHDERPL